MNKIKDLNQIRNVLNNNYHGMKFNEEDMYQIGNRLFINEKGKITIFSFPLNEYYEALDSTINPTSLPFKEYIDTEVLTRYRGYYSIELN